MTCTYASGKPTRSATQGRVPELEDREGDQSDREASLIGFSAIATNAKLLLASPRPTYLA